MKLVQELTRIIGREGVIHAKAEVGTYECDAYTLAKGTAAAVVLPSSTDQVAEVCRFAHLHSVPIVPRGAGTGLAGGAAPVRGGIVLSLARMTRILKVDVENRCVTAEAGVTNLAINRAVEPHGLFFGPDPSSQAVATLGGNIAANAGGPHTLRYGTTAHHISGLTVVLADGEVVRLTEREAGDLIGLFAGSEGTLAVVTEASVRVLPKSPIAATLWAVLPDLDTACSAVCRLMLQALPPSALEMLDRPVLDAAKSAFGFEGGEDAQVALLVEFEGAEASVRDAVQAAEGMLRSAGASSIRRAGSAEERAYLWQVRKKAVAAFGHLAPSHASHDGAVPRSKLATMLRRANAIAERHGLRHANVFHAGDGNLHPILLFDESDAHQVEAVARAGREVLAECIRVGGSISGEHGIGVEKRRMMREMYSDATLSVMRRLKEAFDPSGILNPGKVLPD
ncbi:MAG: hypothetical protein AMXMBFR61_25780 [Fimbriimonadales bacterium]